MRIHPFFVGVFVLLVFLGTILGFQAAGIWSVSGKVSGDGKVVQPLRDDVNTIKGWMTLEQIANVYEVPLPELLAQFHLPMDTSADTAIKDLETEAFSPEMLRSWLQGRQDSSAPVLTATPAQVATVVPLPAEHLTPEKTITGKTTFQDLLAWGVPEETICQQIGSRSLPSEGTIKDYAAQQGMQFSEIKAALQAEVDKTK